MIFRRNSGTWKIVKSWFIGSSALGASVLGSATRYTAFGVRGFILFRTGFGAGNNSRLVARLSNPFLLSAEPRRRHER